MMHQGSTTILPEIVQTMEYSSIDQLCKPSHIPCLHPCQNLVVRKQASENSLSVENVTPQEICDLVTLGS